MITSYNDHAEFKCQQTNGKEWEVQYFFLVKLNLCSHLKVVLAVDKKLLHLGYFSTLLFAAILNLVRLVWYVFPNAALFIYFLSTGHIGTDDLGHMGTGSNVP